MLERFRLSKTTECTYIPFKINSTSLECNLVFKNIYLNIHFLQEMHAGLQGNDGLFLDFDCVVENYV